MLKDAGIEELPANKKFLRVIKEIKVEDKDKFAILKPSKDINFDFEINFDHPVIGNQKYNFKFSTKNYIEEIAKARTFGFLKEVQYLRSIGLALGGSLENAIVLDDKGILNDSLRFPDEFVRHKILDAIGDMSLLGANFIGSYEAFASGHHLNHLLTLKAFEENAFEVVEFGRDEEMSIVKAFG
jgi:UDP-3-O-[3-hydroxymyristoyl] N-acetylglucosamine deacetylase